MASVDMGTATGHVDLDVSGVTEGAKEAKEAFDSIDKASEKSLSAIDKYAQSLEDIIAGGYQDLAKSSEQVRAAEAAVAEVFASNEKKVQNYADAIVSAEAKQAEAARQTIDLQNALTQAEAIRNAQLQRYNDLKQKEGVNQRTLQSNYEKLQRDLQVENTVRQQLAVAMQNEQQATQELQKAKNSYSSAVNAAARSNLNAQQQISRVEQETATQIVQNASKQLKAVNQIRDANKQSATERVQQSKQVVTAIQEEEQASKEIGENYRDSFAVANNAIHETINLIKKLVQEMFNLGKQVIDIGANFEQSMAQVAATSGMSAADVAGNISEYNDLVEAAKEAGATIMFTASQAGEALNYLALAGYNVQESIDTMPDILTIAAAGAMDLGQASDMVTDAMNALNMEIDQTGEFIDKMAKTAQSSNTNVEQLGKSILTVGGTATVLAGGVTELDTAIGLMANSGIKAQQAGTSLRQIILNLTAPASTGAKKIEELSLAVFDAEGKMRPLNEIFQDLNTIMADFTDQERMDAMNDIFDARHIRAANALLQQCGEEWDELAAKIDNADGAAEQMAETMMSTFKGSIIQAKSLLESIAITIDEGLKKNLTDLVKQTLPKLRELNETLGSPEIQARLERMSAQIKDIALNILDKIIAKLPSLIDFLSNVETNLKTLGIQISVLMTLGLIAKLEKLLKTLKTIETFLAANPYLAVLMVLAEIIALVINLDEATSSYYRDLAAQAREGLDVWSQQRAQVDNVTDSIEKYREAAEKVAAENEAQASEVKLLYTEYKKLYEAGEDTTLAIQGLAKEIPGLNQMLAEGKDSFEDVTKAVNDYTDALIYNTQVEAHAALYSGAIKAQVAAKKSLDEMTEAVDDSYKAWQEAEHAVTEYQSHFDDPEFAYDYDEAEKLRERAEALHEIYNNNVKARVQAFNALHDANKDAEEAESDYLSFIEGAAKEEAEARENKNAAIEGADKDYLSFLQTSGGDTAEIIKKNGQAAADALTANISEMKKRIQLRQADEDDLLSVYEGFFGSNQYWDRGNEDLRNHYDTYMGLREKKEKEVRDKMEKDQKERDDLAKKAEKAAKDEADKIEKEWTNSINEGLKDIEWQADFEDWDLGKTTEELKKYLDTNEAYYSTHADAKKALDRKIQETEKKANEERAKDAKKSAEEYVKNWTSGYDKLIDRADKAYKELEKDYNTYRNNLLKGTEITAQQTKKVWDAVSGSYKEEKVEGITSAKELRDNTKQMEETAKFIDQMQAKMGKDASESFMSMFMGMDADAQEKWMQQWSKMSAGQQQEWINAWKDNQAKADELSDKYFADSLEAWKTEYWDKVKDYAATGGTELKKAMELAGEDSVQGWIDGIQEKYDEAEGKTKELYGSVLDDAKKTLGIASPSKEFYAIGEFSIEGFLNGIQSKVDQISIIFTNLGQTAGDKFINAFKSTWDSFVTLLNNTGGLQIPVGMTTTTFGTPTVQGSQVYYTGTGTSYTGLTKADVISAIKEAVPDGNVVLQVGEAEFGRVSRSSLNLLAEQQGTMDLRV